MRIAVYHNVAWGGAKRVVYEHCRRLREAGHAVTLYQPEDPARDTPGLAKVVDSVVTVPLRWDPPSSNPVKAILAPLGNYRRLAQVEEAIAREIDAGGYDLLYAHPDLYMGAPGVLYHTHTPSVYFCQEPHRPAFEAPIVDEGDRLAARPHLKGMWARVLLGRSPSSLALAYRAQRERANILTADRVLANSTYSVESILRAHGRVARVCKLGVDFEFFCPGEEPREEFLLSVGGLHVSKGHRFIVRALGRIAEGARPALVIAGNEVGTNEGPVLEALAARCGVRLEIRQSTSDEELRRLYRTARLVVFAPYLEPLGLVPLEAMACGTAVLGAREGGVRETVIDGVCGRLAERDEGRFAEVAEEMLAAEPGELEEMGARGREYVRRDWTWEKSMEDLLGHFDEVLAGRAAS